MKTERPKLTVVSIKIQEFIGSKYQSSETLRLYDTTAKSVKKLIQQAIERTANGK